MKVKELKALLTQVNDDAEVVVDGCGGLVSAAAVLDKVLATDKDGTTFLIHSANMSKALHALPAPVAVLIYPEE